MLEALEQEAGQLPGPLQSLQGTLYLETGNPQRALEILVPLCEGPEADPAALYNAARAHLAVGQPEQAMALLERSVRLIPNSVASRDLGLLLAQQGRYREAYRYLRPWAAAAPDDSEARLVAALCAVQLKRPNEAEELLSDLDQSNPRVRLLWGKLLLDKADPYGALATLKPLAENPPPQMELDVRRTLADAHAAVGQSAEAVELLQGGSVRARRWPCSWHRPSTRAAIWKEPQPHCEPFAGALLAQLASSDPETVPSLVVELIVEYGRLLATGGATQTLFPISRPRRDSTRATSRAGTSSGRPTQPPDGSRKRNRPWRDFRRSSNKRCRPR